MEFQGFHKIPRLRRDMVITEKIDGTNACVCIADFAEAPFDTEPLITVDTDNGSYALWAQSRKRMIYLSSDNFGFAAWVQEHAIELAGLGTGRHYGEWWGSGIQRGYGLTNGERRFSLFNVKRWSNEACRAHGLARPECCDVVPVLDRFTFSVTWARDVLQRLLEEGSAAAPGFPDPEGIVIYHTHANQMFKLTEDDRPKGIINSEAITTDTPADKVVAMADLVAAAGGPIANTPVDKTVVTAEQFRGWRE